jgi:membrane protein implicated in regulation of membrane protease activity
MDMPLIGEFYILSFAVGFLFVIISAAFAGFGQHGNADVHGHIGGHDIGHTGGGHVGGGHGHAGIGHGSGHSPGHLHTGSHGHIGGHDGGAAGHGHSGHGHSGHGGDGESGTNSHKSLDGKALNTASGAKQVQATSSTQPMLLILGLINPTMLSVFMASVGVAGIFSWKLLPIPIEWTLVPALVFGLILTRMMMGVLSLVMRKLSATSFNYTLNDMIGREAEVTSTIKDGRLGEVTYVMGRRNTAAAKTRDPSIVLPRGTKVIVADVDEHGSFFVEAWPDEGRDFEAKLLQQAQPIPPELIKTDQLPEREKLQQKPEQEKQEQGQ